MNTKKSLFMLVCFFAMFYGYCQTGTKVEAPKIITKLEIGQKLHVGDTEILFSEVISDSRCPEDVTCVWAGEAKLLFQIGKNDILEPKTVVIGGSGGKALIFKNENLEVYVHGITPKPNTQRKIKPTDYKLELYILHLPKEN